MNTNVLLAIFKRNFVAYFTSPIGYVFICVFVFLSSVAAFWQEEFFTAGLANLDQLNEFFPYIMLVFIPAITMGIWAEERRQGTDELLLTIPATDTDVVLGKYLAAVAIYSVSLLFSFLSNLAMLKMMGEPDVGLFFANYLGYWLIGLAMLAIGMIGSFLTGNITVAFVMGALCNAPLVFAGTADVVLPRSPVVEVIRQWSVAARFEPFARGEFNLASILYFLSVATAALFVCLVLVGRRHWLGGRDGQTMLWHYLARAVSVTVALVGLVMFFTYFNFTGDLTSKRINSLSPETLELLSELRDEQTEELNEKKETLVERKTTTGDEKTAAGIQKQIDEIDQQLQQLEQPVVIDAYISRETPESYVRQKTELVAMLKQFAERAKDKVTLNIYRVDLYSDEADQARDKYGIEAETVNDEAAGVEEQEKVILGEAFTHGRNRVVVPFFELGMPVEYELIRAVTSAVRDDKKTIGLVITQRNLHNFFRQVDERGIVPALKNQYNVVDVNLDSPPGEDVPKYDVLVVVQPSELRPPAQLRLAQLIRTGTPTLIFEDPYPEIYPQIATSHFRMEPNPNPQMRQFMPQQPVPKMEMRELWRALGVELYSKTLKPMESTIPMSGFLGTPEGLSRPRPEALVVWQRFDPYRGQRVARHHINEHVFLRRPPPAAEDRPDPFGDDPVTKGLFEVFLRMPGSIVERPDRPRDLKIQSLVSTNYSTGTVRFGDIEEVKEQNRTPIDPQGDPLEIRFDMIAREEDVVRDQRRVSAPRTTTASAAKAGVRTIEVADAEPISTGAYVVVQGYEHQPLLRVAGRANQKITLAESLPSEVPKGTGLQSYPVGAVNKVAGYESGADGYLNIDGAPAPFVNQVVSFVSGGELHARYTIVDVQRDRATAPSAAGYRIKLDRPLEDALTDNDLVTLGPHAENPPRQTLAVRISASDDATDARPLGPPSQVNVILIADIDLLFSYYHVKFTVGEEFVHQYQHQNMAFVMNAIDALAGSDDRFIKIRKRRLTHGELTKIEAQLDEIRQQREELEKQAAETYNQITQTANDALQRTVAERAETIDKMDEQKNRDISAYVAEDTRLQARVRRLTEQYRETAEEAKRERDKKLKQADEQRRRRTSELRFSYRLWAVSVPPIPPLILAAFVFFYRRSQERQGVSEERLR